MQSIRLLTPAALVLAFASTALGSRPPATEARIVTDTFHGVEVADPYRWLEDASDPEVKTWSDAQNAHARSVLDALPGVAALRPRVTEVLSAQSPSFAGIAFEGGKLFAMKRQPPKPQPFLVVMDGVDGARAARTLIDPAALDAAGTTAIDWFVPSPDGRFVAVSISAGGSESGDVHVYDVATGERTGEVIPGVNGGTAGGSLAWRPDGKGFYYTRYPRGDERPEADRAFYMQVYFHELGTPTSADRYEMGSDLPRIAEIQLEAHHSGRVLASVQNGDGGEFIHFVLTPPADGGGAGSWRQLTIYEDRVVAATFGPKGGVFVVSRKDAPRGRVLRIDPDAASIAGAREMLPEPAEGSIVTDFWSHGAWAVTIDRLYLTMQLGGPSEVRVFDHAGNALATPNQLEVGAASGLTLLEEDALLFRNVSYVEPAGWYTLDAMDGSVRKIDALSTAAPVSYDGFEVVREFATSKDGTKVPVNIIRRKGLALDGSHPCVVTAYGGYGVNIEPAFNAADFVLAERGFVLAEANVRGGGEYGDGWHRGGNLTNKQNVFDDFAAVVEHLQRRGYTTPARTAIEGGSNGGLLMGALLTQRPELVKAVVSHVGIYDMLRVELSANGAFNIPEFGTVADESQFRALRAYSPYHNVKEGGGRDGAAYPSVLFLTGANDPRVDPMQSRKMTARLQAAGADTLLRTSANSGHGLGTSLGEKIEQVVDVDAFLCERLGVDAAAAVRR